MRATIERKIERLDDGHRKLLVAASVQGHEFDSAIVAEAIGLRSCGCRGGLPDVLDRIHAFVRKVHDEELPDRTLSVRYRLSTSCTRTSSIRRCSRRGEPRSAARSRARWSRIRRRRRGPRRRSWRYSSTRPETSPAPPSISSTRPSTLPASLPIERRSRCAGAAWESTGSLPEGPARDQLELGLYVILGLSLRSVEGWAAPEVEHIYLRARQLCQQLGNPPQLFPVLWGRRSITPSAATFVCSCRWPNSSWRKPTKPPRQRSAWPPIR